MRFTAILFCGVLTLAAAAAEAHGPQIQLTNASGKLTTRRLIANGPYSTALTPKTTAYVMPLVDDLGVSYSRPNGALLPGGFSEFYSGPGFAFGYGYLAGNPATTPFQPGSLIGLKFADGFKQWNGAVFVDAGAAQFEEFRGAFDGPTATARSSDTGPFAGFNLPAIAYGTDGAEAHTTVRFRFLGDGVTPSMAPPGIYLATFQLTSNELGLAASDQFQFVLFKGATPTVVNAAVASLGAAPGAVQFVPEPNSIVILAGALAALRAAARRKSGETP